MEKPEKIDTFQSDLLEWGQDNQRAFPWRNTSTTPYEFLVLELLLVKTVTKMVPPVYTELVETYPDLESLQQANKEDLVEILEPIGFHEGRAEALLEIADTLADTGVPAEKDRLMELPWVGEYVADAVLCFQFGKPQPMVDTNVVRIYSRLFAGRDTELSEEEVQELAEEMLHQDRPKEFNYALLDFGAQVCRGTRRQKPRCEECFAQDYCEYYQELDNRASDD